MLGISDLAASLGDGEKARDVCPFCLGGKEKETSFSIVREGNVAFYRCFRASCEAKGRYRYKGGEVICNKKCHRKNLLQNLVIT